MVLVLRLLQIDVEIKTNEDTSFLEQLLLLIAQVQTHIAKHLESAEEVM